VSNVIFSQMFLEIDSGFSAGPLFNVVMNVTSVRDSCVSDERVGSQSESKILSPFPVSKVVAASLSLPREIADLVLLKESAREDLAGLDIEICRQ